MPDVPRAHCLQGSSSDRLKKQFLLRKREKKKKENIKTNPQKTPQNTWAKIEIQKY